MPTAQILTLISAGVKNLVLCDAGRHWSVGVVDELVKIHKIPAVVLLGGLSLINDHFDLKVGDHYLKLKTFLPRFSHISASHSLTHCSDTYPSATDFLVGKCNDFSGYTSHKDAIVGIAMHSMPLNSKHID